MKEFSWTYIKQFVTDIATPNILNYIDTPDLYFVWFQYQGITLTCNVQKNSADSVDFETNFKSNIKTKATVDGIEKVSAQLTFRDPLTQLPVFISESNPLPTGPLLTLGGTLVKNAVATSSYNLQTGPYSITTAITTDYILDNIELKFSTNEVKTITISTTGGTTLFGGTLNTSLDNVGFNTKGKQFNLSFGQAFNANENIVITVTQTSNTCLLDCIVRIKTGVDSLMGNPSAAVYLIDETGTPYGVKKADNKPRVSSMPYLYDIAVGNILNHKVFRQLGRATGINNTRIDLWEGGNSSYTFPTTAAQMRVVSTSTDDSSGSTGVRSVEISYLDNNYAEQTEVVFLNGTSPRNTVATNILRINGFATKTTGNTYVAAGNISLTSLDGNTTYSLISANGNKSRQAIYTVPANKTLYLTDWQFGSGSTTAHFTEFYLRATCDSNGVLTPNIFQFKDISVVQDTQGSSELSVPEKIPPMADVKISVIGDAGNSNTTCNGHMEGWLE